MAEETARALIAGHFAALGVDDDRAAEIYADDAVLESWEQALAEITAAGGKPYAIPAGASDHPLGGLGFASWAREVEAQESELGVFFDTIIVCAVTGSTHAGMIAGFAARARERRVIGIDASAKPAETRAQVARPARFTADAIGVGRDLRDDEIILDERYHAGTYGIPDATTLDAIGLAARLEGMITDPVYEGKSMAGLVDLVSRREIPASSTVLYAHLGGQPAINAYASCSPRRRSRGGGPERPTAARGTPRGPR